MNKYNSRKEIRWKLHQDNNIVIQWECNQSQSMGTVKPEKASWVQQFVFNAKCVQIMTIINAGEF